MITPRAFALSTLLVMVLFKAVIAQSPDQCLMSLLDPWQPGVQGAGPAAADSPDQPASANGLLPWVIS